MDHRQARPRSIRIDYANQYPGNVVVEQNRPPAMSPRSAYFTPPWTRPPQKIQKRVSIIVVLIVLLCGAIFALWHFVLKPYSVANVAVYKVSSRTVAATAGGSGILYPHQEVTIQYPESVQVLAVSVKVGQTVKGGQVLLKLDPGQLSFLMQQAQARLAAAQTYLQTIATTGPAARIASAQQQVSLAQSEYNQLQQQQNSLLGGNVTSSINGVVTQVNVDAGETVSANTPLLTLMDESTLVVHVTIPSVDLDQVAVNQKVAVIVWASSALKMNGVVISIVPEADPRTNTFEFWVAVPNTFGQLLAGMSAFVIVQSIKTAFVVPRLAVLDLDSNPLVFVAGADGRAHLQNVHASGRTADSILVDKGLTNGQLVVVIGLDTLLDNQPIHVTRVEI